MNQTKPKKTHFSLVELMVCVAVLAIAASVTIPRYMTHVFQERQSECATALRQIHAAEQAHFRQYGYFTSDLRELKWQPPVRPLYLYGFREGEDGTISTTLNPTALCPSQNPDCYVTDQMKNSENELLARNDLPASEFHRMHGFVVGCVGNIDSDSTLDRFSIDESGQLAHVTNDLD